MCRFSVSFLPDVNQVITDPDLRERNLGDFQGLVFLFFFERSGLVFREATKLSPYKAFSSHRTTQDILAS